MKIKKILGFYWIAMQTALLSQTPVWQNFTSGNEITAIARDGATLWVGTTCGLAEINYNTGELIEVHHSANSNLPSLWITDIQVAQDGTKWIATNDGVVKIDAAGVGWVSYGASSGLPDFSITCLELGMNDIPWAGTAGGGFAQYNPGSDSWTVTNSTGAPLPDDRVTDLAFNPVSNTLWIATDAGGIASQSPVGWQTWNTATGLPTNWITTIALDTSGLAWAGTFNNGILRPVEIGLWENDQVGLGIPNFPANTVNAVTVDAFNRPWVGTENGLATLPGTSWENYRVDSGIPSNSVKSVYSEINGNIFAGTTSGLARYTGNIWDTNWTTANSSLPHANIRSIAATGEVTGIWIAAGGSVTYYNQIDWLVYNPLNSTLPGAAISKILVDGNNDLFVGTEGGGGILYDGIWNQPQTTQNSDIPSDYITDGAIDSNGDIWISTYNGIARWNGATWDLALPTLFVPQMTADRQGNLWLATEGAQNVLYRFNTQTFDTTRAPQGLPLTYVQTLAVDNQNNLWVGVDQGLYVLRGSVWETPYTTANSDLPSDNIRSLTVSPKGIVWIGTTGGLVRMENNIMTVYTVETSGLPDNSINDLTFDPNGNLWAGTDRGLGWYTVTELGVAAMTLSPETVDFGEIPVSTNAQGRAFIQNSGTETLTAVSAQIVGPNANMFTIQQSAATSLALGVQDTFYLQFNPVAVGQFNAFLVINSSAPTSPDTVALTGTATGAASLLLDPETVLFGNVVPGNSVQRNVTITNNGDVDVFVENEIVNSNTGDAVFTLANAAQITLTPGSSTTVTVGYTPSATGQHTGNLIVYSDAASSPDTTLLVGTGGSSELVVNPAAVNLGRVERNTSKDTLITVTNTGTLAIQIANISMDSSVPNIYRVVQPPVTPFNLAVNGSFTVTVRFVPTALDEYYGNLIIETNRVGNTEVGFIGNGVLFQIDVEDLPIAPVASGNNLAISFTPGQLLNQVWLYYLRPGETVWDSTRFAISRTTRTCSVSLDTNNFDATGLIYYIASIAITGEKEFLSGGPDQTANLLTVASVSTPSPAILFGEQFSMISFPYRLRDRRMGTIFTDEMGAYNTKMWRIFQWYYDTERDTSYYREYNSDDAYWDYKPGSAFWLVTRDTLRFDLDNTLSVDTRNPYQIVLQKGWNQIGNPFPFPVAWADISVTSGTVGPPVVRSGNRYLYNQTVLNPWYGYFVNVEAGESAIISIPPQRAGTPKSATAGQIDLTVQLILKGIESGKSDPVNYIGMDANASNTKDNLDWLQAPNIGEFVELTILDGNEPYAANYKAFSSEGHAWILDIASTAGDKTAEITLKPLTGLPRSFDYYLLDLDKQNRVLIKNQKAEIIMPPAGKQRLFKLIVGSETFAADKSDGIPLIPYEFELNQNYPNPFNPTTQITFTLAEKSDVRLDIFDVLGRRVRTLVNNEFITGAHTFTWDGLDDHGLTCASGLYVFHLSANQYKAARKMIRIH